MLHHSSAGTVASFDGTSQLFLHVQRLTLAPPRYHSRTPTRVTYRMAGVPLHHLAPLIPKKVVTWFFGIYNW